MAVSTARCDALVEEVAALTAERNDMRRQASVTEKEVLDLRDSKTTGVHEMARFTGACESVRQVQPCKISHVSIMHNSPAKNFSS